MRLLLATAAIPAFLLTSALACDFNHEAKTQATVTVADGNGNGGGRNGQKLDQPPTGQMALAAPSKPSVFGLMAPDCTGSNCK